MEGEGSIVVPVHKKSACVFVCICGCVCVCAYVCWGGEGVFSSKKYLNILEIDFPYGTLILQVKIANRFYSSIKVTIDYPLVLCTYSVFRSDFYSLRKWMLLLEGIEPTRVGILGYFNCIFFLFSSLLYFRAFMLFGAIIPLPNLVVGPKNNKQ